MAVIRDQSVCWDTDLIWGQGFSPGQPHARPSALACFTISGACRGFFLKFSPRGMKGSFVRMNKPAHFPTPLTHPFPSPDLWGHGHGYNWPGRTHSPIPNPQMPLPQEWQIPSLWQQTRTVKDPGKSCFILGQLTWPLCPLNPGGSLLPGCPPQKTITQIDTLTTKTTPFIYKGRCEVGRERAPWASRLGCGSSSTTVLSRSHHAAGASGRGTGNSHELQSQSQAAVPAPLPFAERTFWLRRKQFNSESRDGGRPRRSCSPQAMRWCSQLTAWWGHLTPSPEGHPSTPPQHPCGREHVCPEL